MKVSESPKKKGGTLLGIHSGLKPDLVKIYSDIFELLVVEIEIKGKKVRIITGYGPQENRKYNEKMPFLQLWNRKLPPLK